MTVKRAIDVLLASAALIIGAPILVLIVLAVRFDSHGPAIFRQQRVGRGGSIFEIHKFRTMYVDTKGSLLTLPDDGRVTRVGRLLRRTKLDELPQLLDVLRGDMSLVGPRPEVPQYVALWPEDARKRILSVRPGITDPASVLFRNENDYLVGRMDPEDFYVNYILPRKVDLYLEYVANQNLRTDLRVLSATLRKVIWR